MTEQTLLDYMPAHFRRWLHLAQRLPLITMFLFTLSIIFDNYTPIATTAILRRWGISHASQIVICILATLYLGFATRKMTLASVVHFLLGTLPLIFYVAVALSRIFTEPTPIPLTAGVLYLFSYGAMAMFYWLSIGLTEWELKLRLKDQGET